MFNTFLSSVLDVSSNMMISTVFSTDNSYFMINKISLVTFFVLFFMKAHQSNLVNRINVVKSSFSIQQVIFLAFLKIIHYIAFIYNLISYSFLISEIAELFILSTSFLLLPQQDSTFWFKSKPLSILTSLLCLFIYIFGTHYDLIKTTLIILIEKGTLILIQKWSLRQPRDKGLTDALSVMLCFIFSFIVFVYEVLNPVQQIQKSDFGINVLFLTTLLLFGLTKHFKVIHQQLTYRSRYYTTIVLILFIAYEMTINKPSNVISVKLVTPALVLLALIELYNLREANLESQLVIKKVQYNTPSFENFKLHIAANKESQLLLIQLCVNFSFMFVELIYGFISNSLGLLSDSVHMLIDSGALGIGLWASFVSHLEPNSTFPFGYKRVEVLSGFVNGVFLLFVVAEIITESLERLVNPEEVLPGKMILVSTLGLGVNLLGLFFFHDHRHIGEEEGEHNHGDHKHEHKDHKHEHKDHQHEHKDHKHEHKDHKHEHREHKHEHKDHNCSHDHVEKHKSHDSDHKHDHSHDCTHDNNHNHDHDHHNHELQIEPEKIEEENLIIKDEEIENSDCEFETESHFSHHHHHGHNHGHNLAGVYLHILADALGSVACIISGVLIYFYKCYIADPITSIVMSIFILTTTVSLLKETSKVLLFQMPKSTDKIVKKIQNDAHKAKIAVLDLNIWSFSPKSWVVLAKVQTQKDQETKTVEKINQILSKHKQIRYKGLQVQHSP